MLETRLSITSTMTAKTKGGNTSSPNSPKNANVLTFKVREQSPGESQPTSRVSVEDEEETIAISKDRNFELEEENLHGQLANSRQ